MPELDLGALARARARETPRRERGCPESERLAEFATGELASAERDTILRHVESCPDCALELAAAAEAVALLPESSATKERTAGRLPNRRWLALAASLVLAASILLTVRALRPPPDELRNGTAASWRVEPPDRGRITTPPVALVWTAPVAHAGYRVTLYDASFTPLATSGELAEGRFTLSTDLDLEPDRTYFWRVELVGVSGSDGARTFSFTLSP